MPDNKDRPSDDPSSAPESGTVRDETSGNQPAAPNERPPQMTSEGRRETKDVSAVAGEER